jgi:heme exporter protein D
MPKAEPEKVSFIERLKQIRIAFVFTAKRDPLFIPLVVVASVVPLAVGLVLFFALGSWVWIPLGVVLALLCVLIVMNLRANTAMLNEAEGKPGAAAQILQTMRGDWRVTPAVQATTQEDYVHRALCRAGVVLVAEGNAGRVRSMLAQEKKRMARVVGDTPIYDLIVGSGEGQVDLRKLRGHLLKLPRNITAKQVNALETRLTALGTRPQMPKGPIPKSMRPKGVNKAMRGR